MKIAIEDKGIVLNLSWHEAEELKLHLKDYTNLLFEKYNNKARLLNEIYSELDEIFTKEGH